MTNTGKQILNLMKDNGKSAPDMTHSLKVLGNGSMQKGFARIEDFFTDEVNATAKKELTKGRIQGVIGSVLGTAALGGLITLIINKKKRKAAHEAEGQEILKVMKSNTPVSKSPMNAMDSDDINPTED